MLSKSPYKRRRGFFIWNSNEMHETKQNTAEIPHTDKLVKAVIFCVGAHFLFFIMGLSAKYLSNTHHVAEIAFYRNFFVT